MKKVFSMVVILMLLISVGVVSAAEYKGKAIKARLASEEIEGENGPAERSKLTFIPMERWEQPAISTSFASSVSWNMFFRIMHGSARSFPKHRSWH